jgi:hypothetical protein
VLKNKDVSCSCSLIEDIIREIARDEGKDEDEFLREVRRRFDGDTAK